MHGAHVLRSFVFSGSHAHRENECQACCRVEGSSSAPHVVQASRVPVQTGDGLSVACWKSEVSN